MILRVAENERESGRLRQEIFSLRKRVVSLCVGSCWLTHISSLSPTQPAPWLVLSRQTSFESLMYFAQSQEPAALINERKFLGLSRRARLTLIHPCWEVESRKEPAVPHGIVRGSYVSRHF